MASDPWDQAQPSASATRPQISSAAHRSGATAAPIPDDWEDDDDDDEPEDEEQNQRIWDDANSKLPAPMPSLIVSSSSNSSRTVVSPPPGAFQAPMRILKRPKSTPSSNTVVPTSSSETLQDREVRYLKARERIFGEDTESTGDTVSLSPSTISVSSASSVPSSATKHENGSSSRTTQPLVSPTPNVKPVAVVSVRRNPRGPSDSPVADDEQVTTNGNATPKGFGGRRLRKKDLEDV